MQISFALSPAIRRWPPAVHVGSYSAEAREVGRAIGTMPVDRLVVTLYVRDVATSHVTEAPCVIAQGGMDAHSMVTTICSYHPQRYAWPRVRLIDAVRSTATVGRRCASRQVAQTRDRGPKADYRRRRNQPGDCRPSQGHAIGTMPVDRLVVT
eukprot:scaffold5384_cov242-Prasinococcus_capsulatus_cf.AAC.2